MQIKKDLESVLDVHRITDFDRVETRECESERFDGVQVNIYGNAVYTRPIIKYATEHDDIAIENMYHCDEAEPYLGLFIAYLPEQQHPAFI
jgi:hypothetical protein